MMSGVIKLSNTPLNYGAKIKKYITILNSLSQKIVVINLVNQFTSVYNMADVSLSLCRSLRCFGYFVLLCLGDDKV